MYISVVKIDKRDRQLVRHIANRQEMHKDVQSMFGDSRSNVKNTYRIVERNGDVLLIIRSEKPIDPQNMKEGMTFIGGKESREYSNGMSLAINTLLTPMKSRTFDDGKNRKIGIRDMEERLNWCKRRFLDCGASIERIVESRRENFRIRKGSNGWSVDAYEYNIVASITDEEKFNSTLVSGIGRNGAYGAGLMLITERR